jgi:hypothetical protein
MSRHSRQLAALVCFSTALCACDLMQAPAAPPAPARTAPGQANAPAANPASGSGGKVVLALSSATGRAGETVPISASLAAAGKSIAGTQNDITFDPKLLSMARPNGKPDCAANPAIGKEGTAFSFLPAGCKPGVGGTCNTVRALVLSLSGVDPITSGSTLYTCKVQIAPHATAGTARLSLSRVGFSNPSGQPIDGGGGDGVITIGQ